MHFGGRAASATVAGQHLSIEPGWGYSTTARIGYAPGRSALVYAGGGCGGHRYETRMPPRAADFGPWNHSFVLLGGGEARVSDGLVIRAEFRHLDGSRNQFMLGALTRF